MKGFSLAMIFGVIFGTYSSIYIANTVLVRLNVTQKTVIKEDNTEISRSTHRHVLHPHENITSEDAEVQAVCNAVWTDAVKAKWKTYQDSLPTPGSE